MTTGNTIIGASNALLVGGALGTLFYNQNHTKDCYLFTAALLALATNNFVEYTNPDNYPNLSELSKKDIEEWVVPICKITLGLATAAFAYDTFTSDDPRALTDGVPLTCSIAACKLGSNARPLSIKTTLLFGAVTAAIWYSNQVWFRSYRIK